MSAQEDGSVASPPHVARIPPGKHDPAARTRQVAAGPDVSGVILGSSLPLASPVPESGDTSPPAVTVPEGPGPPTRHDLALWAEIAVQVGAVVYLAGHFRLENRGLYHTLAVAWAAFVVHLFLPARWRLPFFGMASVAGIVVVVGVPAASWILGLGALLILLCHLPVRFPARVAGLLLIGAVLAAARVGWLPGSDVVPPIVWPILGSMFMFRIATYLWSLRYRDAPVGPARTAGYFFMLPNACFPLFPVVDYKTWARSWYDADAVAIAQRGVKWMVRGVVHLLLYRLVYYHLALAPSALQGFGDLLQFVVATFLLYLRVSGMFHLVVGLLHLFGFHLPETHRLYFFSSSITDFWRRINIYWKDFMMKLVYFPSFFALRRLGQRPAMVLATVAVFVATWALHAYQWFWLLGERLLSTPDMLFWGLLGVLAVGNSLWETRRGARRTLRPHQGWSLGLGVRRLATFAVLCLLWSLWTSESVAEWGALFRVTRPDSAGMLSLLLFAGLWVAIAGFPWGAADLGRKSGKRGSGPERLRTSGILAGLAILSIPGVEERMSGAARPLVSALSKTGPNAVDAARQQRGYYEDLANPTRLGMPVWFSPLETPPAGWRPLSQTEVMRRTEDFLYQELRPGTAMEFKGAPLTINRWGMRGRDYERRKPPNTFRIALLGASDLFGEGVGDDQTLAAALEGELNPPQSDQGTTARFEVLNFAVSGYSLLQQLASLEVRARPFHPDLVIVSTHNNEHMLIPRHLQRVVDHGLQVPYPEIEDVIRRTGVTPGMPYPEADRRLRTETPALVNWVLQRIADVARAAGAQPALLMLRLPTVAEASGTAVPKAAGLAGIPVIDLTRSYPSALEESFRLAPWDNHPNAEAHRLLAEALRDALVRLGLVPPSGDTRPTAHPPSSQGR